MTTQRVVVVGAGVGGLAAAIDLAVAGFDVTVIEAAGMPGGKMRTVDVGGVAIDAGPTVFTMRWVFDELIRSAGRDPDHELPVQPATVLARHAWRDGGRLDLCADEDQTIAAIRDFAGGRDADGYRRFCQRSREIHDTLLRPFMAAERPSPFGLVRAVGMRQLGSLWRTVPYQRLATALRGYFVDPRLRQLFGRYATYVGSSPYLAPATLMLIAHVEKTGVWRVDGGMRNVARALHRVGVARGARYRFGTPVSRIEVERGAARAVTLATGERVAADVVVFAGDSSALGAGLLGEPVRAASRPVAPRNRSLSAITWCLQARTSGFALSHHNVFFSDDYRREFRDLFTRFQVPADPTVYVCAQARDADDDPAPGAAEPLLVLVNAPARGDNKDLDPEPVFSRAQALLHDCGLELEPVASLATNPGGFARLFPGSGGALYGRANHGPWASFARAGAATRISGLYLAGGSVHPGAGVPMATLSGRLAARRVLRDLGLPRPADPHG